MSDARQNQNSQQSSDNPAGKPQQKAPSDKAGAKTGIGSSQGQDTEGRPERDTVPHTGRGTADIERGSGGAQGSGESLADDPVGAFKERP